MRIGEALGLQWGDFDKAERTLRVERQWLRTGVYGPTKTEAGKRVIFLPDEALALLRDLRPEVSVLGKDERPIFASLNGTPLGHRNVTRRGWEPAREIAARKNSGLADVDFHDLRHAAASRMIASGVDDALVADQLGHQDTTITRKVYTHVYDRASKGQSVREALGASLGGEA